MLLKDTLTTAFKGITVNTSRSLLTMLGIIIGVGSVVLMVSIGRSFQNYILTQLDSVGTNTMDVYPTGFEKFGGNLDSLTFEDYEAISQLSTVQDSTPIIIVGKPISYGREEISPLIMGAYSVIMENYGLTIDNGRTLSEADELGAKNSVVIGSQIAEDLFGNLNPLGKRINIGEVPFTVVGVLQSKGSLLLSDLDNMAFIPFSTARAISGQRYLSYVTLRTVGSAELATQDIKSLLRDRHNIDNPEDDEDKDDFRARGAEQITEIVGSVTLGLTIFLSLVAGISLLVGGIGIMNIMLVSVTERTREIGLRKAVGAKRRDIMLQFLFEAVALTVSGGAIGIAGGVYLGWLMSRFAAKVLGQFDFIVSFPSILLAVGMAMGVGIMFGFYPAKRAAALSPMEALRYE